MILVDYLDNTITVIIKKFQTLATSAVKILYVSEKKLVLT